MRLIDRITQTLIEKPSMINTIALNRLFQLGIPFNASHGLKIQQLSQSSVSVKLPHKLFNLNHLRGIHACAIALLGEYCAGLLLAKNLGIDQYRIILKNLNCDYLYQGRMDLIGVANKPQNFLEQVQILQTEKSADFEMLTTIKDLKANHVANVTSLWQLKKWEQ